MGTTEGTTEETTRKRKQSRVFDDDDENNAREKDDDSFTTPSSLWEVIVKWDDVSFKHILPSLDLNDVKFLYGVNAETREMIKRSSREKELKKGFKVYEMLSISTLEWAWESKSLWPSDWLGYGRKGSFCSQVAGTNKLELLKWIREEKKCRWDEWTINAAAYQGNLEIVKYCVAHECPINESACNGAAQNGHLEVLKYLHEEAKAPWDSWAVRWAHNYKHPDCVQYLLDNNCPLPEGWRYENGELYSK